MNLILPGQKYMDGVELGGYDDVDHHTGPVLGLVRYELWVRFNAEPDGRWRCTYLFDVVPSDEFEVRDTPREAFEALIQRLIKVNGPAMNEPAMTEIIQACRTTLDNSGHPEVGR